MSGLRRLGVSGRLTRVLESWCPPLPRYHFYYPKAFTDFGVEKSRRAHQNPQGIDADQRALKSTTSDAPLRPPRTLTPHLDEIRQQALGCVDTYRIHRMMAARVTTAR